MALVALLQSSSDSERSIFPFSPKVWLFFWFLLQMPIVTSYDIFLQLQICSLYEQFIRKIV